MKWIKLLGAAIAVTTIILLINHFTYKPALPPLPPPAAAKVVEEVVEEVAPTPTTPTKSDKAPRTWGEDADGKGIGGLPPRPKRLEKATKAKIDNAKGTPKPTKKKSGGGSSSGGGNSGGSSGGGSGASGGGVSGGSTGGTVDENTSNPDAGNTPEYWYQTGPDPAGRTSVDDRHRRGCPKFMNVPGRAGTANEGNPCPICGG